MTLPGSLIDYERCSPCHVQGELGRMSVAQRPRLLAYPGRSRWSSAQRCVDLAKRELAPMTTTEALAGRANRCA
jgi:hypothetical protein